MRAEVAAALIVLAPMGCRCSSDPVPVGHDAKQPPAVVGPPPVTSELPAERPKRFAVSYGTEADADNKENLLVGNIGSRQSSTRGKRSVAVYFSPSTDIAGEVYEALREYACDKVETELQRGEPKEGGTVLQVTAGTIRKVVSDKGAFDIETSWAGAFQGCAQALQRSFPVPGSSGYVALELRFPDGVIETPMVVETDLGPDQRGIEWKDDGATAIVYVAKVRPLDIDVRCGGGKSTFSIDLATQGGLEIERKADAGADDFACIVTVIDDPADTKGEVASGPNARLAALGAPRLDLAGEPAPRKAPRPPVRTAKELPPPR